MVKFSFNDFIDDCMSEDKGFPRNKSDHSSLYGPHFHMSKHAFTKTEHSHCRLATSDILAYNAVKSPVDTDLLSFLVPKEGVTV